MPRHTTKSAVSNRGRSTEVTSLSLRKELMAMAHKRWRELGFNGFSAYIARLVEADLGLQFVKSPGSILEDSLREKFSGTKGELREVKDRLERIEQWLRRSQMDNDRDGKIAPG